MGALPPLILRIWSAVARSSNRRLAIVGMETPCLADISSSVAPCSFNSWYALASSRNLSRRSSGDSVVDDDGGCSSVMVVIKLVLP